MSWQASLLTKLCSIGVAGLMGAGAAVAQDGEASSRLQNGTQFGNWVVTCEAVAVNETLCVLSQRLVRSEGNSFLAELVAFNDPDKVGSFVAAIVPVGVYLPSGFSLRLEDSETVFDFEWQACSRDMCEALLELDGAQLELLESAGGAVAGYRPAQGAEPLVFSVGTEGLLPGLQALARALGNPDPVGDAEAVGDDAGESESADDEAVGDEAGGDDTAEDGD